MVRIIVGGLLAVPVATFALIGLALATEALAR